MDLRDPARLKTVLDGYLSLKVCPVVAERLPRLLFPATVEILLPDGSRMTRWGTVIRHMDRRSFLVQFEGPLDLGTLDAMTRRTETRRPVAPARPATADVAPARPKPPPPPPEPDDLWDPSGFDTPVHVRPGRASSRARPRQDKAPPPEDVGPSTAPPPAPKPEEAFTGEAPEPAVDPSPRFGPTVDAFVAGPDPDDAPAVPDDRGLFEADRTTLHEAEQAQDVYAVASPEGIDAFGEGAAATGPVQDLLDEDGIPAGWTHTGEFEVSSSGVGSGTGGETDEPADDAMAPGPADRAGDPADAAPGEATDQAAVFRQIEALGASDKQKLARTGNRSVRGLLVKDRMKNVHQFVFRNPRITLEEVVEYSRLPGLSKEAIRVITADRTWMASIQVVLALVRNPGTPMDLLPGLIQRLGPAHWRLLAKSGDVRSQVSSLAKKLLLASGS